MHAIIYVILALVTQMVAHVIVNPPRGSSFYKNILALAMAYLLESNKLGIIHASHRFYWSFEYLNFKLIS
jgi:hypothetical protein